MKNRPKRQQNADLDGGKEENYFSKRVFAKRLLLRF